jgi:general secretion pathway protein J
MRRNRAFALCGDHPTELHSAQGGFTLFELLVAITLLSFMSVMMYGGLQFGARVWERRIESGGRQSNVMLVQDLLRREVSQAVTLFYRDPRQKTAVLFAGGREELVFVAPVPLALAVGGRHMIGLRVEQTGTRKDLVLTWLPIMSEPRDLSLTEGAGSEVLLEDIADLRFSYFGRPNDRTLADWTDSWQSRSELPQLVKIEVDFAEEDPRIWPELTAAVVTSRLRR